MFEKTSKWLVHKTSDTGKMQVVRYKRNTFTNIIVRYGSDREVVRERPGFEGQLGQ